MVPTRVLATSQKYLCAVLNGFHGTQPIMTTFKNGEVTRGIAYVATETLIVIVFETTFSPPSLKRCLLQLITQR